MTEVASTGVDVSVTERLRVILDDANIPTLVMVLVHLTGDERWLDEPYTVKRARPLDDNDTGGLSDSAQNDVRAAALEAITGYLEGRLGPVELTSEQVTRMLSIAMVETVPVEYGPLLLEELGIDSRDVPVPTSAGRTLDAVIIGSGISGLCAAIKLQAAGIPFTIVEKNLSVGGTWHENEYPGVGVDTPSHFYSFAFSPNPSWNRYFARGRQVQEYLESLADKFALRDSIQYGTEVTHADWDNNSSSWKVRVTHADGTHEVLESRLLFSCVGQVNRPAKPAIRGLQTFEGSVMHTAEWQKGTSLAGKRVAVIGTGASAMQLVPAIVDEAERLVIFQRSKQWAIPHPNYHREVTDGVRTLMELVPLYTAWYRLRAFWNYSDRLHPLLQVDPDWPHQDRSINAANESHRVYLTEHIKSELGDRADLIEACVPGYPPYGKRPLVDNGWFRTVRRDDVDLITERVVEVRPSSVVSESGQEFEVDVIVLATGFRALQFLWPMEIRGRSGKTLAEQWGHDDARAYLGIAVPDFPNLFILNGPNTNAGHGGSAVIATELQVRYVMELLAAMAEQDLASVEVTERAFWTYNDQVDEALNRSIWVHPGMTTYYRNDAGRVVLSSPWKYIDYWNRTRHADLADYRSVSANPAYADLSA